jgi:PAS domain S-box-containing protein
MNAFKRSSLNRVLFALALTGGAVLSALLIRPFLESDTFGLFCVVLLIGSLLTWVTALWRDSRHLLTATLSSMGDAVLATDSEGRITFLNPAAETLTGWPRHEAMGKPAGEIIHLIDERTRQKIDNPLARAIAERVLVAAQEHTALISRSGATVPIEHSAAPVRDGSGAARGYILVFRDIHERRHVEEQATHAQKMEAVSRLAAGVAGDFNNVLTVITGYAELLRAEIPSSNSAGRYLDEIAYAGERAAALTRHLLAFSHGSTVQPRVLDLGSVIAGMKPILNRLLGQNIELILLTSTGLGRVKADPAQIEQVVVNLAKNSRDAMPEGGKLVIETVNVEVEDGAGNKSPGVRPGSYVMLAVSDTGIGMETETRSRLFEPFFTTKAPGKGSGLGLSTAYGTIKQADGQVTVYTQPNCGTIFEIYLPRVTEAADEPARKVLARGSETILLVEDEEGVRKLVLAVLQSNGYDVLEADNGTVALAAYEKNSHKIDLLITAVVMAQMNGFELGKQLSGHNPGLKILYISGYRDNATAGESAGVFLHKPFSPDVLLGKVREVLDG